VGGEGRGSLSLGVEEAGTAAVAGAAPGGGRGGPERGDRPTVGSLSLSLARATYCCRSQG
jgi:hypothetical protein